jgi:hypothetical protein
VDLDDVTLGHSARDVAREFAKNGPGLLRWFDGTETILNITADISQATVAIDDSPPFQGYCHRFMHISGVSFTINTADGRLQETLVSSWIDYWYTTRARGADPPEQCGTRPEPLESTGLRTRLPDQAGLAQG